MKTTKTPDHNPTGRTRPKRKMGTVLRAKLSKYRARVSEFEDDAPSSTVVRWLVVLLLLLFGQRLLAPLAVEVCLHGGNDLFHVMVRPGALQQFLE